jgi:F-type H+-transporting ATPase subunit delta
MADNATLARPYAKAVFELAQEGDAFAQWSSVLTRLTAVSQDADFSALLNDPRVQGSQLAGLLIDVCKDFLPQGGDNFINLLVQNDRLTALADIDELYAELVTKAQQAVNAEVVTAIALSDSQTTALTEALEARLGLKVILDEVVDASLVGGAIVRAGDMVIDGSVRGRIEKLSSTLLR